MKRQRTFMSLGYHAIWLEEGFLFLPFHLLTFVLSTATWEHRSHGPARAVCCSCGVRGVCWEHWKWGSPHSPVWPGQMSAKRGRGREQADQQQRCECPGLRRRDQGAIPSNISWITSPPSAPPRLCTSTGTGSVWVCGSNPHPVLLSGCKQHKPLSAAPDTKLLGRLAHTVWTSPCFTMQREK